MTDPEDDWPPWRFGAAPKGHLHALGVVALNYNMFESNLFGLFRHHLEARGMPRAYTEFLYGELNSKSRIDAIKETFATYETDPHVLEALAYCLALFDWASETRNLLLHAHQNSLTLDDAEQTIRLAKRSKGDFSKVNFVYLTRNALRGIADEMNRGVLFLNDLYVFLQYRDDQMRSLTRALFSEAPTLPKISAVPSRIEVSDRPQFRGV